MKLNHLAVLAPLAVLAACSDAALEVAAPAAPPPVTRADTGGRDLGLRDVVVEWGPPMTVNWGRGLTTSTRVSSISLTVLNASDVDIFEGTILCIFETDGERTSSSSQIKAPIPAHGFLVMEGPGGIGSEKPSDSVVCGVDGLTSSDRPSRPGRAEPLPGSVAARSVVKDAPAA